MKGILSGGRVPYSVVCLLSFSVYAIGYQAGHHTAKPPVRVAIAEKGAVVLEAALNHPSATPAQMKALITDPINSVLRQYLAQGFVIVDTSRNDQGEMTVTALPADTVDITNELRKAAQLPLQKSAVSEAAVSARTLSTSAEGAKQ
ncbi:MULTISPECIES: hypothetical protein [Burkholderia cepacia complex]|nr:MULTISPECIES: hypothetical protein [Burkholderia cepacia complex]EGD05105.1 hypothetical protein B1M_08162 [Burkholderia sp. TJI49]MBU9486183.1 hypothetical protein [Burkholderia multivorans]MBU9488707.1 hypothetical protein [Burkholderia multivorans]MBU9546190.1 hypothetical protein [Burkholderia multivorans]MBY4754838.1 hypothetical protein [Burkholderia dolosa]